jgi:aryl-alcohol dehydrogenase (NADP+)
VDLAKKYNIQPCTLANAFVINRQFVTSSIVGATSIKNLKETISAIDINLSNEMLAEIEKIHLSDPNPCV